MVAAFTPRYSGTLDSFKAHCGFVALNWQQQITSDPGGGSGPFVQPKTPGPLIDSGNVIDLGGNIPSSVCLVIWTGCSLIAPPPYYDPPEGGYVAGINSYPFYYPDSYITTSVCTIFGHTGYCPPFPFVVSSDGTTLSFEDAPARGSLPKGSFLAFKTSLVGISNQGTEKCAPDSMLYCAVLYSWIWRTTFNGTAGGVDENSGGIPIDPGSGTGGITITGINDIDFPSPIPAAQIETSISALVQNTASQIFTGTLTLTNTSANAIRRPLQVVFVGMPQGVTLMNQTGALAGTPYVTLAGLESLFPGQSVVVNLQFQNTGSSTIDFDPVIYSGRFMPPRRPIRPPLR